MPKTYIRLLEVNHGLEFVEQIFKRLNSDQYKALNPDKKAISQFQDIELLVIDGSGSDYEEVAEESSNVHLIPMGVNDIHSGYIRAVEKISTSQLPKITWENLLKLIN